MSVNKVIGFATTAALVSVLTYGCSSTTTDTATDGGPEDAAVLVDSGRKEGGVVTDGGNKDAQASSCVAGPVTSVPNYVSSPRFAGKCSDQDLIDFRAKCYDSDDTAACNTWANAHKGCYDCEGELFDKTPWGMVVGFVIGEAASYQLNLGGWLEALDPATKPCATKVQALLQCRIAACASNCPLPGDTATEEEFDDANTAFRACLADANKTTCKSYYEATSCVEELTTSNPALAPVAEYLAATAQPAATTAYFKVLKAMCGTATTTDGGTDAASDSASDSSTTSDASDGSTDAADDGG